MPGDEEVGDDDVESRRGRGEEAPSVVDHEPHVGAVEEPRIPRSEVGPSHGRDLGHHLDDRRVRRVQGGRRARADSGRHADEGDTLRSRMQQQRHEALPPFVHVGGASPEHVVVVEAELEVLPRVDHRDNPRRALRNRAERFAWVQMRERRAQRIEEDDRQERGVGDGPGPAVESPHDFGEHHVGDGRDQESRPQADRGQDDERRGHRPHHAPGQVRRRQRADRARCALPLAKRRPEGRKDRARRNGPRPCRHGGEGDDSPDILGKTALHAEVPEAIRPVDETPDAHDRREARDDQAHGGDACRRSGAKERRREPRAGRDREQKHEAHRGEGVDRVVENLSKEGRPEDLEPDSHEPSASRGEPQEAGWTGLRGRSRWRGRLRSVADPEGDEAGQRVGRRRGEVARPHADGRRKAEAHDGDTAGPADRVQRVERAAAAADGLRSGERVTERRKGRAETEGDRKDREPNDGDAGPRPARGKGVLGRIRREQAEDTIRPDRPCRHRELEPPVSPDRRSRRVSSEKSAEAEPREVPRDDRRRGLGGCAENEPRRPHPEELERKRPGAREREAEPQEGGHVGRRPRARQSRTIAPTATSSETATATSAGPSGQS